MNKSLQFIIDYWPLLAPLVYEIIARLWPTKWNISLLDKIWQLINALIPNVRKPDGLERAAQMSEPSPEEKSKGKFGRVVKNFVKVAINRHILKVILLLVLSVPVSAQIWQPFKGIRLVNVFDSTTATPVSATLFYNQQTQRIMAYDTAWFNLRQSGGGGTTYTFSNGLTESAGAVVWGGPLTQNVSIDGNAHTLTLFDLGLTQIQTTGANIGLTATAGGAIGINANGDFQVTANNGSHSILMTTPGVIDLGIGSAHTNFTGTGSNSIIRNGTVASHLSIFGSAGSTGNISGNLSISTGDSPGPGAQRSGEVAITTGLAFADKPGRVWIGGGQNTSGDDSGDIVLSSAQYTGDSITFTVSSAGMEFRTHGDVVVRPNSLTTEATFTLENTKLQVTVSGQVTLVAGTATVIEPHFIPGTTDNVLLTTQLVGGTIGIQYIDNASAGQFDIVSTSNTDTSTVGWFIVTMLP